MASQMANIPALKDLQVQLTARMKKAVEDFRTNLLAVRTGRANVHMLDNIRVDYYGSEMPISQLAQLSAPEPTQIVVQPFDVGVVGMIEKAIRTSSQGFNPMHDGKVIRVPIPPARITAFIVGGLYREVTEKKETQNDERRMQCENTYDFPFFYNLLEVR